MDKNQQQLKALNDAINDYVLVTKKTASEILVEKGKQLIFGSHSHGANFMGLYDEFLERKPPEGRISSTISSLFKRGEGIKISEKSYQEASSILGGASSGVFQIRKKGRARLLHMVMKGKRVGQITHRQGKRTGSLLGRHRALQKVVKLSSNEKILNVQNLAANIELVKRESARGYSASAFLYKRYRRTIERLAGKTYRRGQLKGVSATDAVGMHKHVKILVPNKAGDLLGKLEADVGNGQNWLQLSVFTNNVNKAGFRLLANRVMKNVTSDIRAYVERKMKKYK